MLSTYATQSVCCCCRCYARVVCVCVAYFYMTGRGEYRLVVTAVKFLKIHTRGEGNKGRVD